jgi:hypothetical protein
MKIVYQTNADGAYVGQTAADESPLEPGVFLIPAGCVEEPPPAAPEGKMAVWRGAWLLLNVPVPELAEETPVSDEERLANERAHMVLTLSQLVVGLAELDWITDAEATAWLEGRAVPNNVAALIAQLPDTGEDGTKPKLRTLARTLRPSEIRRSSDLLAAMAAQEGATADDLDNLFRTYAAL